MTAFEVRPTACSVRNPAAVQIEWRANDPKTTLFSSLDPWFRSVGAAPKVAIDVARIGVAVFCGDRLVARPLRLGREIDLTVSLTDPDPWRAQQDELESLLRWLTGDEWNLTLTRDDCEEGDHAEDRSPADRVSLLSGGLDSFCGAIIAGDQVVYMAHADATAVRASQNRSLEWLGSVGVTLDCLPVWASVKRDGPTEPSRRSRSFLFMSIGVALAAGRRARILEVPENGYTSLNPPLAPNRGGILSTRSTHPTTISRFNNLLTHVELDVRVVNPYESITKGELVRQASAVAPSHFEDGIAATLSCAKLDGHWYRGGNSNLNCGLCFACIVRRSSILSAGLTDRTTYLCDVLQGDELDRLQANRHGDMLAVQRRRSQGYDLADLLAVGSLPPEFDIDASLTMINRAAGELRLVNLP